MKPVQKRLFAFLLLALILALVIVFEEFLMAYVIHPVVALGWMVWRMIVSLHQSVLWITLLLACLILTLRLIPPKKNRPASTAYHYNYKPPNRYENWRRMFEEAAHSKNEREFLRENLETLSTHFEEARMPLPDTAKRYLSGKENNRWSMTTIVPGWLRKLTGAKTDQDIPSIEALLSWMETELEIQNEDNPNP